MAAIAAYIPHAKQLTKLWVSFLSEDADLSALFESIINSRTIHTLGVDYDIIRENDTALLFDLITKTRSVNQLNLMPTGLAMEDFYHSFDLLEKSDSIVKFEVFICPPFEGDLVLDYDRIASSILKSGTLNVLVLYVTDSVEFEVEPVALDKMFETCSNLDRLKIKDHERTRSTATVPEIKGLIQLARTFAGAKITKKSSLPRELFNPL